MKNIFWIGLIFLTNICLAQNSPSFIHVDQIGYLPNSQKVAVLSNPQEGYNASDSYNPSGNLEVRERNTDDLILTVVPMEWKNGQTHNQSGDQGWWLDFSSITQEGEYYIVDPVSNEKSDYFIISDGIYNEIMKTAGRMFFYNRSGMEKPANFAYQWNDGKSFHHALQDENCHYIYDKSNDNLQKDLSGGWFDAGDYNKYVTFTYNTLHNLLRAYEENPQAFSDDWNIPESGNGIPDMLDEIKWELDWLFKMTNQDGSVHIKMGSKNHSENAKSPPSANTDPRYYGPTCTSASLTIASVFAHASKIFSTFPNLENYANELLQTAETCYAYSADFVTSNSLETNCDDGSIVAGDADQDIETQLAEFVSAGIYLYELTDNEAYHQYVKDYIYSQPQIANVFWGPYIMPLNDALVLYTKLPKADTDIQKDILESLLTDATNNYNGYYGISTDDLYRSFMPNWSYHWGSNNPKASYGNLNDLVVQSGVFEGEDQKFNQYVDECIHYFHGVNPQDMVYLSNMYSFGAKNSVNEIYHLWFGDGTKYDNAKTSELGPAPGFVTGGPNQSFSVSTISPPSEQPAQKAYLDFNTSFPDNSWEITEPAIYYQAAYIRLLAHRVDINDIVAIQNISSKSKSELKIFPNPSNGIISLELSEPIIRTEVYDTIGQLLMESKNKSGQIDLSSYVNGNYLIRVNNKYSQWVSINK